jgi:hypothetical protein
MQMKQAWKAIVLFLGLNAVIYGTVDIWPAAEYKSNVDSIKQSTRREQQST